MTNTNELAKKLRREAEMVRIARTDPTVSPTVNITLSNTKQVIEQAANLIELLDLHDPEPLNIRVKILLDMASNVLEGKINEFIQKSVAKYADFNIRDIKYDHSTGVMIAMILYQYRERTRS